MARINEMKNLSKTSKQQKREKEKADYHEKYHKFKEEGHPFWPDVIFEDTIAIVVVLAALIGLILFVGVPLGNVADPSSKEFVPRPELYFLFLFELLKYFPGALEWVGVVVVPSALIALLLLIPFLDKSRRPAKAGFGMNAFLKTGAILSVFGVLFLTFKAYQTSPPTVEEKGEVRLTSQQQFGRNIFKNQGCLSCHVLAGEGAGIPLDGTGSRMEVDQIHNYVENPQSINPNTAMPSFIKNLTHTEVEAVARYLSTYTTGPATPPAAVTPRPATPGPAATPSGATPASPSPAATAPGTTPAQTSAAKAPPSQPASHVGRTACLACHEQGIAGAPKRPADHAGRTNEMCAACHKAP